MKAIRMTLAEGIRLTCLPSRKFKTGILSAQFITPLRRDTASLGALIPSVLRRGTTKSPGMGELARRLDTLYGARIDPAVRKIGERQCAGFVASFIDEAFTPGNEKLLEPVVDLISELLLDPATWHGRFQPAWFESEKANLMDAVRGMINDKREWAGYRLLSEMCRREPYGVPRLGDEKSVSRLGPVRTFRRYRDLLASGRMEWIYCGSAEPERVRDLLRSALSAMPRENMAALPSMARHRPRRQVREVTDHMDVTQGKLGMGFACAGDDVTAFLMGNMIFGGGSNSKLFLNVREKLSLCYYASSIFHRQKRLITVSSGIEFENYERTRDEILKQLKAVQDGKIEDWEFEAARSALLHAYASMGDAQSRLENFYLNQAVLDLNETPEELAENVKNITPERVQEAMSGVNLDTIYFLRDNENE